MMYSEEITFKTTSDVKRVLCEMAEENELSLSVYEGYV